FSWVGEREDDVDEDIDDWQMSVDAFKSASSKSRLDSRRFERITLAKVESGTYESSMTSRKTETTMREVFTDQRSRIKPHSEASVTTDCSRHSDDFTRRKGP